MSAPNSIGAEQRSRPTITQNATLAALLVLGLTGCGEDASSGAGEPLRVYRSDSGKAASFFAGAMPTAVTDDAGIESATEAVDAGDKLPEVVRLSAASRIVFPGQKQGKIDGTLSTNSAAVALGFEGGSGYWVVPAGSPDYNSDGALEWHVKCDYSPNIAPGYREITAAAIRADGTFGRALTQKLCIAGRTADYINACNPKSSPAPQSVISLSWDTNVDLDLQVITPEGRLVSPKQPSTMDPDDTTGAMATAAGVLDRDSNAGCNIDGIRFENLVFETVRSTGTWGIYADLFDACKQSVVHFTASVYLSSIGEDGYTHLEQVASRQGILLSSQASGGESTIGTFLFEVNFD
jgi:hypothetical protein